MSDYEDYVKEQEERLLELNSKIDIVKSRAGMTEDAEERVMVRDTIIELDGRMNQFEGAVGKLRGAGSDWEGSKDNIEKAYLNVKDSLRKASSGLLK